MIFGCKSHSVPFWRSVAASCPIHPSRPPSLTKIAKKITGAHWSGPRFFGLLAAGAERPSTWSFWGFCCATFEDPFRLQRHQAPPPPKPRSGTIASGARSRIEPPAHISARRQ
ncbi:MAG: hypothetical protein CR217_12085 [Beijerinckiaceae bacterium]|nr:MAG: hypothetical protein CR217_12085 [Beijerinckiaceae bacterium]